MADELNKKFLVAVDEEDTASRAVHYVGNMFKGRDDFEITLLHFIPPLPPDHFESEADRLAEQNRLDLEAAQMLEKCRTELIEMGLKSSQVIIRKHIKDCPSLAECIIEEQKAEEYGTIVIGHKNLSRIEEFLVGSVSSSLIHLAERCAIWVVA